LTESARNELLKQFKVEVPRGWSLKADHMTINQGKLNPEFAKLVRMGDNVILTVVALGTSKTNVAVKIQSSVPCANEQPHVTIAVAPGGKAYDSNFISKWQEITPFQISAVIGEV